MLLAAVAMKIIWRWLRDCVKESGDFVHAAGQTGQAEEAIDWLQRARH